MQEKITNIINKIVLNFPTIETHQQQIAQNYKKTWDKYYQKNIVITQAHLQKSISTDSLKVRNFVIFPVNSSLLF